MKDEKKSGNGGGTAKHGSGDTKIMVPYGRDNSSHKVPSARGGSMGGGRSNLSHSLKGTSST